MWAEAGRIGMWDNAAWEGLACGLRLEWRVCIMLTVMLGGTLDVTTRVQTRILRLRPTNVRTMFSDPDTVLKRLSVRVNA